MKKLIAILLVFNLQSAICSLQSFGQSIDSVEYFYDVDPGVGNGNKYSVVLSDSITDSISFNFPGLTPGFHTLNFRVKDTNGVWSLYESHTFFLNDTIFATQASFDSSSAEYFFNTDPGPDSATATLLAPGDSIADTTYIVTDSLAPGFHYLYMRVRDSNHVWSLYEGGKFYLNDTLAVSALPPTPPLEYAEYFYDLDPGIDSGLALNSFTPADSILLNDTLTSAPLTAGTHYLYVRVRDTMNTCSLTDRKAFVICNFVPVPDFSADTVCLNKATSFTDLSTNVDTSAGYTYSWDFDSNGIADDTTRGNTSYIFNTPGTYTVSLTINNTNGCIDTVTKTVYVDSLPTALFTLPLDTICKDDTLNLAGGSPAGGVYSGIGVYGGAFYGDSVTAGNHLIFYTYYNSDSCSVTVTDLLYISPCTGIEEYELSGYSASIHPNPFRTSTVLTLKNSQNEIHNLRFVLLDIFGKEVQNLKIESSTLKLERENMPAGIYLYKVIGENGNYVSGKLVVTD